LSYVLSFNLKRNKAYYKHLLDCIAENKICKWFIPHIVYKIILYVDKILLLLDLFLQISFSGLKLFFFATNEDVLMKWVKEIVIQKSFQS